MASFDFTVDTKPMARQIDKLSDHVKGTTAAVVAMQTAVVVAHSKAADHVCKKVNEGFYAMIHSQISQKMARLRADVESLLMKLNAQTRQLAAIRGRMERDYRMVCERYTKTFTALDKSQRQRVFELEKPTIDLALRQVDTVANRTRALTAVVPLGQDESLTLSQRVMASNVKHRCSQLIGDVKEFLRGVKEQDVMMHRIMLPQRMDEPEVTLSVPVAVCTAVNDPMGNLRREVYAPNLGLDSHSASEIITTVSRVMNAPSALNVPQATADEFYRCVADSTLPQRVKDQITRMFQDNFTSHD